MLTAILGRASLGGRLALLRERMFLTVTFRRRSSRSVPTYPASHGCIRVTIPGMDRAWDLFTIGTPIWIYRT